MLDKLVGKKDTVLVVDVFNNGKRKRKRVKEKKGFFLNFLLKQGCFSFRLKQFLLHQHQIRRLQFDTAGLWCLTLGVESWSF